MFSVKHHIDQSAGEPFSWQDFNLACAFDSPVPLVAALFRAVRPGVARIITSGRQDHTRQSMLAGMRKHDLVPDRLYMRKTKDQRRDSVVKEEIYRTRIEPYFDVRVVVDDRPQVVDMWRSIGLYVIAVKDPGVEPEIGARF